MYEIITQPGKFSHGYSAIPLRVNDSKAKNIEKYKYIVNIIFNLSPVSQVQSVPFQGDMSARITSSNHGFKIGDLLFLQDSFGDYTGYYTVMDIISNNQFIINMKIGVPFGIVMPTISNVIKYSIAPSPDGDIKLDLSNTIKDFVSENLKDVNDIFPAPNSLFEYDLVCGYEGAALFKFDDNIFVDGNVGFVDESLTSVDDVPFQLGDLIIINQDLYAWNYYDNQFVSGHAVGFIGIDNHAFREGDDVVIEGQITNPSYNGPAKVISVDTNMVVIDKLFGDSSPSEGGTIHGVPVPEYNTTATITGIEYIPGTGVVIKTDKPFERNTPKIGGEIRHSDGRIIYSYSEENLFSFKAYNSRIDNLNYDVDSMDKYVCQNRQPSFNNISTILGGETKYRIEASTKSWLLVHGYELEGGTVPMFKFYDKQNNLLSTYILVNQGSYNDYYFPVGLNQLEDSAHFTKVSGADFINIKDSISSYTTQITTSSSSPLSNEIKFELNNDCSRYEMYHLMWKDAMGSWVSYPFKMMSSETIDVDRKNYYKTSGNWDNNSFGYDSFDRGDKTFFARSRNKVKINSGWIDEHENRLIVDMMKSASVYLQLPTNEIVGVTLDDKSIKPGKKDNEQVWSYGFTAIYSMDDIRL